MPATDGGPTRSTRKGAGTSKNGQRPDPDSEYGRFERLTKRLVSVPKKEIEKQAKTPR